MSSKVLEVASRPVKAVPKTWRRFRRRPRAMQIRTAAMAVAVIGGTVGWIATAPGASSAAPSSSNSGGGSSSGGGGGGGGGGGPFAAAFAHASTSTRGVTAHSINVVFPVVSLNSLAGKEGFSNDVEFADQANAIHLYVNQVNDHGGIAGRKINPMIVSYDPTNETQMRALCKQWTQGSPGVFAVVDGMGTWTGADQLCITQEGHTPMIAEWTTISSWTKQAAPYLWWTGVDQTVGLQALVNWGLSSGLLAGKKVGVIVGSRASDQAALNQVLLPDLERAGVTNPVVATIDADPTDTSTTNTEAPLVVAKLESKGVQSVIPLIPFNVFFPILQAQTQQNYFPRLLLSDYESSIDSALGLIPIPYEKALDGQEGVTTLTLGGVDDPRPESQGGYDPGVRSCYEAWVKKYPKPQGTNSNGKNYIEEQGPIASWCQAVRLFETAAEKAGHDLNRKTFVNAMSEVKNFQGTLSPTLSYSKDKFYGPTQYRVVRLHSNVPPSAQCDTLFNGKPQGTCWTVTQPWTPLPETSP